MEFFLEAMGQPSATLAMIGALCAFGALAIVYAQGNQLLGVVLYPVAVAVALCASKFFIDNHFYAQRVFDKWVIFTMISAAIGVGVALVASIVVSRLVDLTRASPKPVDLNHLRVSRITIDGSRAP